MAEMTQTFTATVLGEDTGRDPYAEMNPLDILFDEPKRQIGLRSRYIAASAARWARENAPENINNILDPDIAQMLERLSDCCLNLIHNPQFLDTATREFFVKKMSGGAGGSFPWEVAIRGTVVAAEKELSIENFNVYESVAERASHEVRFIGAGLAIQRNLTEISNAIVTNLINYYSKVEFQNEVKVDWWKVRVSSILSNYSSLLVKASEAESRFNLLKCTMETLATTGEFSEENWLFFFSTVEMSIGEVAGDKVRNTLSLHFRALENACEAFSVAGSLYAYRRKIISEVDERLSGESPVDESFLSDLITSALLDRRTSVHYADYFHWYHIKRNDQWHKLAASTQSRIGSALIDSMRNYVERNWLDYVEDEIKELNQLVSMTSIISSDARSSLQTISREASRNFQEGISSMGDDIQLERVLLFLLDETFVSSWLRRSEESRKGSLRKAFVLALGVSAGQGGLSQTKTLVAALKAGLLSKDVNLPEELVIEDYLGPLDYLCELSDESKFYTDILPQLTAHGLGLTTSEYSGHSQEMSILLARKLCSNQMVYGSLAGYPQLRDWASHDMALLDYRDVDKLLPMIGTALQNFPETPSKVQLLNSIEKLSREIIEVMDGVELDKVSLDIANEVATKVFERLDEYRDITSGEAHNACAKDTCLTLRRCARAYIEQPTDKLEFIDSWWNSLVNLYLVNRVPDLFPRYIEHISSSLGQHVSQEMARSLTKILREVFPLSIVEDGREGESLVGGFVTLEPYSCVPDFLNCPPSAVMPDSTQIGDAMLSAVSTLNEVYHLNLRLGDVQEVYVINRSVDPEINPEGFLQANLAWLQTHLCESVMYYEWNGTFSKESCMAWAEYTAGGGKHVYWTDFLLSRIALGIGSDHEFWSSALWTDFCNAHRNQLAQQVSVNWLKPRVDQLCLKVAERVHREIPVEVNKGVESASIQKCARDFGYILSNHIHNLSEGPYALAKFNSFRYVCESIAPFVGYGECVWRFVWQSFQQEVRAEDPHRIVMQFFEDWTVDMEKTAELLESKAIVCKKLYGGGEPIFSPDFNVEKQWRCLTSSLICLSLVSEENRSFAISSIHSSLTITKHKDIGENLRRLVDTLADWFLEHDLTDLETSVTKFDLQIKNISSFDKSCEDFNQSVVELIERVPWLSRLSEDQNEVKRFLCHLMLSTSGLRPLISAGVLCPSLNWGGSLPMAEAVSNLKEEQLGRLSKAILQGLSLPDEHLDVVQQHLIDFGASATAVKPLLRHYHSMRSSSSLSSNHWAMELFHNTVFVTVFCKEHVSRSSVLLLHSLNVHLSADEGLKQLHLILEALNKEFERVGVSFAPELLTEQMQICAVSRVINEKSTQVSEYVVENNLSSEMVDFDKCKRDTSIHLQSLAYHLMYNAGENASMSHWYKRSVAPFVRSETVDMSKTLVKAFTSEPMLEKFLPKELTPLVSRRIKTHYE